MIFRGSMQIALLGLLAASASAPVSAGCLDSEFVFETSALERLVRDPVGVLADQDRFWRDEPAQEFATAWAAGNGFTIDRAKWRRRVSRFSALSPAERHASPLAVTAEELVGRRAELLENAPPLVCAYLPADVDVGVPVYFTAFIPPRSFVTGGIVISVDAPYWRDDADNIANALIHEIWHVGYSRTRSARSETPLEHAQLYGMLDQLQNEGSATYVAYRARARFPAPDELDFRSLESPDAVARALREVNEIFRRVGSESEERTRKRSWRVGVDGRAYYVAGAHMARTIDVRMGREELIRTVSSGPLYFVEAYNALVAERQRIEIPDVTALSERARGASRRRVATGVVVALLGAGLAAIALFVFKRS